MYWYRIGRGKADIWQILPYIHLRQSIVYLKLKTLAVVSACNLTPAGHLSADNDVMTS